MQTAADLLAPAWWSRFELADLESLVVPLKGPFASNMAVVYAIQAKRGGPIKIGRTTYARVESRLGGIQTGHPYELQITKLFRADGPGDLERRFHEAFSALRLNGEWFAPAEELAGLVGAQSHDETGRVEIERLVQNAYERGHADGYEEGDSEERRRIALLFARWLFDYGSDLRFDLLDAFAEQIPIEMKQALLRANSPGVSL